MTVTVYKSILATLSACLILLACVFSTTYASADVPANVSKTIVSVVKEMIPGGEYGEVQETPIPDLYKISVGGGSFLFLTGSGEYILSGELYRKVGDELVNLSENERKEHRVALLGQLKASEMIIFPAAGDRKAIINVFTDVDCGYCRKLHQEVPELNSRGVEVRYLAFPRSGVGSMSYAKIASAWCDLNPQQALTELKNGKKLELNVCEGNPVAAQYEIGNEMGVQGTPALVLMDGTMIPGYRPADDLLAILGL